MTSGDQAKRRRIGVSSWSFHTLFEPDTDNPGAALMDVRDFPEMIADRYHIHNVEIILPHFLGAEPSLVRDFKSRLEKAHSRLVHMPLDYGDLWEKPAISSTDPKERELFDRSGKRWRPLRAGPESRRRIVTAPVSTRGLTPAEVTMKRREFIGTVAAAAAGFMIVPRRVLGGPGHIPPSDMILLAQVGCGMQAQRQVNVGFVRRPELQFVAVVDPNRDSQGYVDWTTFGNRNRVRQFIEDPTWAEGDSPGRGGRGGRDVARHVMETYYKKQNRPATIRAYEDFREMLEKETDIQGIINITPDHQHANINIAALKKGKSAIAHKPVASVLYDLRRTLEASQASAGGTHLLAYSNSPDRHTLAAWINGGVIGTVREVHNWTNRPFWPQGYQEYYESGPPVPAGFNWTLYQGPEPDRPYHPDYTFCLYRGWYAYGAGCLGDMGFYSLWQPYRILNLGVPEWVEGRPNNDAAVNDRGISKGGRVSQIGLPKASTVRWRHPATASRPAVDTFWYDGGNKPQTPEELYEDREDLADEGMLIVGDKGKILCDFRATNPRLIPKARQTASAGSIVAKDFDTTSAEDEWVNALKTKTKTSKGSFEQVAPLAAAGPRAHIALRVPYKRLFWDAAKMEFANSPEANRLIRREQTRPGWEL